MSYVTNFRLKGAMLNAEVSANELAAHAEVDVKSVVRWISEDRIPYPVTRVKVSKALDQPETYLWPALLEAPDSAQAAAAEVETIWPTRSAISAETWHALFSRASTRLDILVYAGGFLIETLDLADVIRWKAASGVAMRILVGDPGSDAVRVRGEEEQLPWLAERCRTTSRYLAEVSSDPGVEVRTHGTTLYASMFRFDDLLLVNTHAYGAWACQSPVHQLRAICGGRLFEHYAAVFERVWVVGSAAIEGEPVNLRGR